MRAAKSVWIGVILLGVGLGLLAACSSSSSQPATAPAQPTTASSASQPPTVAVVPPQGADGATLVNDRCTVCHTADRIKNARKTRDEWNTTVTRMQGRGAKLTSDEKTLLVDYLAKTYGQ
jgi:cytochrome c5